MVATPSNSLNITAAGIVKFDGTATFSAATFVDWTSWTPTVVGGSTAGTTTYVTQSGFYMRIANMVIAQFYINISGNTGTGNLVLNNLPITINTGGTQQPVGSCMIFATTYPSLTTYGAIEGVTNTTTAKFIMMGTAGHSGYLATSNSSIGLQGTFIYQA